MYKRADKLMKTSTVGKELQNILFHLQKYLVHKILLYRKIQISYMKNTT
jgi:hypothetical protein